MAPVGFVIGIALLVCVGVLGILRPVVLVRWAKGAHPEIPEDDAAVLWFVRFTCLWGVVIGLFLLLRALRSLLG